MAAVQLTIEMCDLVALIAERAALRDRIRELEATPLQFSLRKLANDVSDRNYGVLKHGYTPDQRSEIFNAIESGGARAKPMEDTD
jgi:hypothetical protein